MSWEYMLGVQKYPCYNVRGMGTSQKTYKSQGFKYFSPTSSLKTFALRNHWNLANLYSLTVGIFELSVYSVATAYKICVPNWPHWLLFKNSCNESSCCSSSCSDTTVTLEKHNRSASPTLVWRSEMHDVCWDVILDLSNFNIILVFKSIVLAIIICTINLK